ncbi:GH92 family glycosyl hydrolase [Mucilaginibacter sp. KACC 22063]|uniref:GH92 family glycosyl hydrolase n=1 Tax=Mucilaginibacter sp. KACC 22063 TaxID=3025666 RepID=UPI002366DB44|nr:GH92 family glycosyl hydrolase [Mucilaginibacter sp. KACC 22063]WDF57297.1 GH92 family glycosyl hydrolase [Mucilaginibacter sp. KACC 22063]
MLLTLTVVFINSAAIHGQGLVSYVQPMCGTAPSTTKSAVKHGVGTELNANTIPAVTLPFAMTQWTPETRQSETKCQPPYVYQDTVLTGFRGTHWLSGSCTQDYGSFTIMPVSGHLKIKVAEYRTHYSHQDEVCTPYYYSLLLRKYQVKTEVTATLRCAMFQFTANKADSLYLLITPNSDRGESFIKVDQQKGLIWGYNPAHRIYQGWGNPAGFSGYFVIEVQRGFKKGVVYRDGKILKTDTVHYGEVGGYVGLYLKTGEQLRIRVGTSFTSLNAALANLKAEIPGWDFEALKTRNQQRWESALGQIMVKTSDVKQKKIFYTALYHAMQHPRLFNDVAGTYPRFAGNYQIEHLSKGNYYDDFSMWDIYRGQLPIFEILNPQLINDCVRSMILKGQQGGWLPIFPCWNSYTAAMIGDHGTAFIASAYVRGIRDYDVNEAYRLMHKNAFEQSAGQDYKDGKGRRALDSYLKFGYIPMEDSVPEAFHKKEQVSRTLEYAFDDFALAQVAKGLHKTKDYQLLLKRSLNYQNVFDPSVGMARGRYQDKHWYQPFKPTSKEPYITEGTPQQYTFYVPQDVKGLAQRMGGAKMLEKHMDKLFDSGEYWHGNEPGQQIPYMYNYTGSPWKTQARVQQILEDEYSDGPGGLSGNDDAGQMSAWYVLASLGFYPLNPATSQYLLSSPIFDGYQIKLPSGKQFRVVTHRQSPRSVYIASIKINGKVYTANYIEHGVITKGGVMDVYLSDQPNKSWGVKAKDQPASITQ